MLDFPWLSTRHIDLGVDASAYMRLIDVHQQSPSGYLRFVKIVIYNGNYNTYNKSRPTKRRKIDKVIIETRLLY